MEKNEMVSVIIPVYNSEKYLQRCLDSVYKSTYKNIEIICVNDGSTDQSLEILRRQNDSRLIIVEQSNGGVSKARNVGLSIASGDYIAFIDSDDWIHPQYFECLLYGIQDADIAHCSHIRVSEDSFSDSVQIVNDVEIYNQKKAFSSHNIKSFVWGKLFRRKIIEQVRFPEQVKMAEDKVFLLEVLAKIDSVAVIPNELYYYFDRPDSTIYLSGSELFPAGVALYALSEKDRNPLVLRSTISTLLSYRYLKMFSDEAFNAKQNVSQYLKKCNVLAKDLLPFPERILMGMFSKMPTIYRAFRIMADPSLLKWEKDQKLRQKNEKE